MSSQVPTTNDTMISDIAFESSYPYSLYPIATNGYINVGDNYAYQSEVRLLHVGGDYYQSSAANNGPLTFHIQDAITISGVWGGSSGIRHLLIVL